MGVGIGIGIDMIESENVPVNVQLENGAMIKEFRTGQNTMLIQDETDRIYKTGLKLDYVPKEIKFKDFDNKDIKNLYCGRKHYVILTHNNQLYVWGNLFKEKPVSESEGFGLYFGDDLFNKGKIV